MPVMLNALMDEVEHLDWVLRKDGDGYFCHVHRADLDPATYVGLLRLGSTVGWSGGDTGNWGKAWAESPEEAMRLATMEFKGL